MRHASKLAVALGLALVVGCNYSIGGGGEECCGYYPAHYGGETVTTVSGSVVVQYEGFVITYGKDSLYASGSDIGVSAELPAAWTAPLDAGITDAGSDAEVDADAGAGAAVGEARGWGTRGMVALIKLGHASPDGGASLVDAQLIRCMHPFEKLVAPASRDAVYLCKSAVERPAIIEPLTGAFEGDPGASPITIDATTAGGGFVRATRSTSTTPRTDYMACSRASFHC